MYLDQRRHNRIGCIGLAFPHCVFSSASSNFLFDTVNTYNGCICLSFSHCAFPNATSNFLDQKCKITLFAFVKMFSTVCIQMYPRMVCMQDHCSYQRYYNQGLSQQCALVAAVRGLTLVNIKSAHPPYHLNGMCKTAYSHCCFQTSNYKHSWEAK